MHSINIFRKATYWKKLIIQKSNTLYYILFLESYLFRAVTFSKEATFRTAAFLQDNFSEELLFHTDLIVSIIMWAVVNVPAIPWSSVSVFVIVRKANIHSLKCTVPFSFVVPLFVTCCHSLSLVVTRCTTRLSFINDRIQPIYYYYKYK